MLGNPETVTERLLYVRPTRLALSDICYKKALTEVKRRGVSTEDAGENIGTPKQRGQRRWGGSDWKGRDEGVGRGDTGYTKKTQAEEVTIPLPK